MNEEDKKLVKDTIKILEVLSEMDPKDDEMAAGIAECLKYLRDYCKPRV